MSNEPDRIEPSELSTFGESDDEGVRLTPEEWQRVRATVEWMDRRVELVKTRLICSYCDAILPTEAMPAHIVACPSHPIAKAVAAEREACAAADDFNGNTADDLRDAIRARGVK